MSSTKRIEKSRIDIEIARKAASEWHKSDAGKEYHSRLGKENYKKRITNTYTCTFCGKSFQTKHVYTNGANRFCNQNCKAKYYRHQKKCYTEAGENSPASTVFSSSPALSSSSLLHVPSAIINL